MSGEGSIPEVWRHEWLGAVPLEDGRTRFSVWAPRRERIDVEFPESGQSFGLQRQEDGHHVGELDGVEHGALYHYRIDGGLARPDPASRFQPRGVHGPSQVVSRQFPWTDGEWAGVSREELVIYELHLGTFTGAGTYLAAIERLDELVELGITAIELMPVADSAGRWNWGYDGVNLFAPRRTYGTPDDFRRLVDAAHAKGLAVILDVVYNHLGPEGNYLRDFGPYLSDRHHTVWGSAPNFDDPEHGRELRQFFIANAIYWYDEFHIDGLRIDAIHCMLDDHEPHVVQEIGAAVERWRKQTGRPAMLIAESNIYDPQMLEPLAEGGMGFDAEWCDDLLHSVFAVLRPDERLCDRPYRPGEDLDQTLRRGFVYQGTLRTQRKRQPPGPRVDTGGLIYSIQNHDFIGNHPLGKRLHQVASPEAQRAAAALLLLSPAIPMLFMGEEFASDRPFHFFVDFGDQGLRQAVVAGRQAEYPQHDWSGGASPISDDAFESSRIGSADDGDRSMLQWYRMLIDRRKRWRAAGLLRDQTLQVDSDLDAGRFVLWYRNGEAERIVAVRLNPETDPIAHRTGWGANEQDVRAADVPEGFRLIADSRPGETERDQLKPNHAKVFGRGELAIEPGAAPRRGGSED